MKRVATIVTISLFCVAPVFSKVFTECELANELKRQGFPEHQISDWLCIIEAESARRTHAVGGPDADGSFDYGLFQINDRYWCSTGAKPGKGCNVYCKDLLTDDITKASACAQKIYRQQGLSAWVGWTTECVARDLPTLAKCSKSDQST